VDRLVLGIASDHPDSSAALVGEDGVVAAIAEERLSRRKHCDDFPAQAIAEVLRIAGVGIEDVTDVAVARDARANLLQKAAFLARHPRRTGRLAVDRIGVHRQTASTQQRIVDALGTSPSAVRARLHAVEHHMAHVSSAFYWAPVQRCVAFSSDGAGDFATTMWARCEGSEIEVLGRTHWPHSLGVFYTALSQFIGFDRFGEEFKVMGLAAYGENRYGRAMRDLIQYRPDTGLRLDLRYFSHHVWGGRHQHLSDGSLVLQSLFGSRMSALLGLPRLRHEPITRRVRDIAASLQARYEEIFLRMVYDLVQRTGIRDVALAGGCALNSVANGRMITEGYVDRAFFQPAAADDGTAVGAALYTLHNTLGRPRGGGVGTALWGTEWTEEEIRAALDANGRPYRRLDRDELLDTAARSLAAGRIVGWFQGREEWGPRALGNRSILCNPSLPDMKDVLNARIKDREPFRPFAPVCREEDLSTCFDGEHPVPYMIIVYKVRPQWRERLPAITHEDHTGRVQTVRRDDNALLYDLLGAFRKRAGIPVLLNTSFNENEPIVHTPGQAVACFERTQMDCLGIGPFWLERERT